MIEIDKRTQRLRHKNIKVDTNVNTLMIQRLEHRNSYNHTHIHINIQQ